MKKIYFAPTPWCSSSDVFEDYRHQTPNNLGIWDDIITVKDPDEAEFLIIQDDCPDKNIMNKFEFILRENVLTDNILIESVLGRFQKIKLVKVEN